MDITSLIGTVNLFKADKGHVLTISTKEKTFFVPIVLDEGEIFAYAGKVSDKEFKAINKIVALINSSKIYKSSLPLFTLRESEVKDGPKVLKSMVVPGGCTKMVPPGFAERCQEAGYELVDTGVGTITVKPRDYSRMLERPDLKKIFDINREYLKAEGISDRDLTVQGELLRTSIKNGLTNGALITGPAGTGKSVLAKIIGDTLNMPLVVMQITANTEVDDLIGSVMAVPTDTGRPDFKFVPGPLLDMWVNGGGFVAEEYNTGKAGVLSVFNTILDGSPYLTVATGADKGGTKFYRHPDFVCFATANPGYPGTEELNPSSTNRLSIANIPDIPKEIFCKWGQEYSKMLGRELPTEFFEKLFVFAGVIAQEAKKPTYNESPVFNIRNAKRLCATILQANWDFEHFYGAICMEYLNHLSINNDNQELLTAYTKNEVIRKQAKELFDLYATTKAETIPEGDILSFDELYEKLTIEAPKDPTGGDDGFGETFKKRTKGIFGVE